MKLPSAAFIGFAYLFSELALAWYRRSHSQAASKDAGSRWILWIGIGLGVCLAVAVRDRFQDAELPRLQTSGLFLFGLGIMLRWWAISHLGRFFTIDVAIATDHQLIDTGPFRFVRHPSYSGALLAFIGFGLILGNWASLIALILPVFLVFLYRIRVEERVLTDAFGDEYRAYSARTSKLVPGLF